MKGTKPMILISSSWNDKRSFKMIPIWKDCAYNECIFDVDKQVLAIVSKEHKNNFHMMPRLDRFGRVESYDNGNQEERVVLDTYYEYYIEDKKEIIEFIESMADNAHVYDYRRVLGFSMIQEES